MAGPSADRKPRIQPPHSRDQVRLWTAAALTAAVLFLVLTHEPYRFRLVPIKNQLLNLPHRAGLSYEEIQESSTHADDYSLVMKIKKETLPESTILISSEAGDGRLSQPLFVTWFLHPRVILRKENLQAAPGTPVDYVIVTPNFRPDPNIPEVSGPSLIPISERAVKHYESNQ